jgi:hypothetical protein
MKVVPSESSAQDRRRRSEDAVRRIRAESGRRIEQTGRVRAFSSWCALATLAGGISLAALDAHEAQMRTRAAAEAARQAEAERALFEEKLAAMPPSRAADDLLRDRR